MVVRRYWWIAAAIALAVIAIPATLLILKMVKPEYLAVGYINVAPRRRPTPSAAAKPPTHSTPEFLRTQAAS